MDNETKEMFNLILNKIDTIENKVDTMQNKIDTIENKVDTMQNKIDTIENEVNTMQSKIDVMKNDITEIKEDVKTNYKELLTLDNRTMDIKGKVSSMKLVTAQNCYDITLLKDRQG